MTEEKYPQLDVVIDHVKLEDEFHEVIPKIKPLWKRENIVYERSPLELSRGVLNTMVKCFDKSDPLDAIMIRVYNDKFNAWIDRAVEIKCIEYLHELDCAPEILCTFKNGFCYRYINGEILSPKRLVEEPIWKGVARNLAKFNSASVPGFPATDESKFQELMDKLWAGYPTELANPDKNEIFKREFPPMDELKAEYDELTEHCHRLKSPIVLTHNDTRPENIIWNQELGKISFVDFEAMNYNYQAHEIAAHMSRYCGLDPPDYALLPTEEFQRKWLKVYLEQFHRSSDRGTEEVSQLDVDKLYVQVTKFYLFLLLLAAISGPVFETMNILDNKLDMLGFALVSLREYRKEKDRILKIEMPK